MFAYGRIAQFSHFVYSRNWIIIQAKLDGTSVESQIRHQLRAALTRTNNFNKIRNAQQAIHLEHVFATKRLAVNFIL